MRRRLGQIRMSHVATDDSFADLKPTDKVRSTYTFADRLKFLPFAAASSLLCILLYITVGGIEVSRHLIYIIISYAIGVAGLTFAYSNVAFWIKRQKSGSSGAAALWFSIFYNNAFYVFDLILFSTIVFPSFASTTAIILTQVCSVALPAWLSSISA